jgi:hypothetical protein
MEVIGRYSQLMIQWIANRYLAIVRDLADLTTEKEIR